MTSALNPTQIASFRQRLEARARELGRELSAVHDERLRASVEARETVGDAGDQGAYRARDELRNAEESRDAAELQAIDEALTRIDEGRYGECIDCALPIPPARLRVLPAALRCIDCQQRHDRLQATTAAAP